MCAPDDEGCNGLDDDCDGLVDEDLPLNGCGACGPVPEETCSGADDDCDGVVDEGFDLDSHVAHCGACGVACQVPNAESRCVAGGCEIAACAPGWAGEACDRPIAAVEVNVVPQAGDPRLVPEPRVESLEAALEGLQPGARIVLWPGRHETTGVVLDQPDVRLEGQPGATLVGTARAFAVVEVRASGIVLSGLTITSEVPVPQLVWAGSEGALEPAARIADVTLVDVSLQDAALTLAGSINAYASGFHGRNVERLRLVNLRVSGLRMPDIVAQQEGGMPPRQAFLAGVLYGYGTATMVGGEVWDLAAGPAWIGVGGIVFGQDADGIIRANRVHAVRGGDNPAGDVGSGWAWGINCGYASACEVQGNRVWDLRGGSGGRGGFALGFTGFAPAGSESVAVVEDNVFQGLTSGASSGPAEGSGWAIGIWMRRGTLTAQRNQIGPAQGEPCERAGAARLLSREDREPIGGPRAVGIMLGDDLDEVRSVSGARLIGNSIQCVISDRQGTEDGRAIGILAVPGGGGHVVEDTVVGRLDGRHVNGVLLSDDQGLLLSRVLVHDLHAWGDVYGVFLPADAVAANLTVAGLSTERREADDFTRAIDVLGPRAALHSSILQGAETGVYVRPDASITVDHTLFDPRMEAFAGAGARLGAGDGNQTAEPGFVDPLAFDYRLRPDSPAIDRGREGAESCGDEPGAAMCRLDQGYTGGTAEGQIRAE